jgi:uncharacterized protein YjbI with pentapeptide repeats
MRSMRGIVILSAALVAALVASPVRAQLSGADCASAISAGDSLVLYSPATSLFVHAHQDGVLFADGVLSDASSWLYVWTSSPYDGGNNQLDLDPQIQQFGNGAYSGHVIPNQNIGGPVFLQAGDYYYGQRIQLQSWDKVCHVQIQERIYGNVMGLDSQSKRVEAANWAQTFQLAFRYRDSATGANSLNLAPGDVALYSQPNFQGNVWVLHLGSPIGASFVVVPGLNDSIQSVQFGIQANGPPPVGVIGYPNPQYGGTPGAFAYNIPSLKSDPNPAIAALNQAMSSIQILPLDAFISQTKSCVNCNLTQFPFAAFQSGGHSLAGLDLSGAHLDGADLSGIDFAGTRFTGATLSGIKVSGSTNFSKAVFEKAVLDNSDLRGAVLQGAFFKGTSLRNVIMNGMDLTSLCGSGGLAGADLAGAQLQQVNLACPGIDNFSLRGATLAGTDFTGAVATGTIWSGAAIQNAILNGANLTNATFDGAQIACASFVAADLRKANGLEAATFNSAGCPAKTTRSDFTRAQVTFNAADLSLSRIPVTTWPTMLILNHAAIADLSCAPAFAGANLAGAVLEGISLIGCATLQEIDLSNADLANSYFNGADLSRAHLSNAILSGAKLQSATLNGTNLVGAVLSADTTRQAPAANLESALLSDSDLTQATLTGADLEKVTLIGEADKKVSLSGTTLTNTDFTGAFLYNVDASGTKGAVTAGGANFANATVVATDFGDANLASSAITTFTNAVLYGSTLGTAKVGYVTFDGALLNQKGGQVCLPLPNGGCKKVSYGPSQPPMTTDKSVTCPDGKNGPCNDNDWYLSKQPPVCPSSSRK